MGETSRDFALIARYAGVAGGCQGGALPSPVRVMIEPEMRLHFDSIRAYHHEREINIERSCLAKSLCNLTQSTIPKQPTY